MKSGCYKNVVEPLIDRFIYSTIRKFFGDKMSFAHIKDMVHELREMRSKSVSDNDIRNIHKRLNGQLSDHWSEFEEEFRNELRAHEELKQYGEEIKAAMRLSNEQDEPSLDMIEKHLRNAHNLVLDIHHKLKKVDHKTKWLD